MSLGLDLSPLSPSVEAPRKSKSAGIAFLLSLLLPGAGHIYCGKAASGLWTFGFFLLTAAGAYFDFRSPESIPEQLQGVATVAVVVIYLFAFLDAYSTAREINDRSDEIINTNNPRIAATLNLLTSGFGYWYLGERKKGWIVFLVLLPLLRLFRGALGNYAPLLNLISCGLALDAYRIAHESVAEARGLLPAPFENTPQRTTRLPAAIPVGLALLLISGLVGLWGLGLAMQEFDRNNQTGTTVDDNSHPKLYRNPNYKVVLLAPGTWRLDTSQKEVLVSAQKDNICLVALMQQGGRLFRSPERLRDDLRQEFLSKNAKLQATAERSEMLGNLSGAEVEFKLTREDDFIIEHYLLARRGLALYVLVTIMPNWAQASCEPEATWIRENISIGK